MDSPIDDATMDAGAVVEEESWLGANMWLIIINLILGAIVFILIWFCNETPPKKEKKEKKKDSVGILPKEPCQTEVITTVVETIEQQVPETKSTGDAVKEECHTETITTIEVVETVVEEEVQKGTPAEDVSQNKNVTVKVVETVEKKVPVEEVFSEETTETAVEDFDEGYVDKLGEGEETVQSTQTSENGFVVIKEIITTETTEVIPEKSEAGDMASYNIIVKTGGCAGAGTDANVFITLYGDKGSTGKLNLETSMTHKSKFEQGNYDTFEIEAADVGTVEKINIGHDNKGGFAGWYLGHVSVFHCASVVTTKFVADRWLDKSEGDGRLDVDLYPFTEEEAVDISLDEIAVSNKPAVSDEDVTVSYEVVTDDVDVKECRIVETHEEVHQGEAEVIVVENLAEVESAADEVVASVPEDHSHDVEGSEGNTFIVHDVSSDLGDVANMVEQSIDAHVVSNDINDVSFKTETVIITPDAEPVLVEAVPQITTYNVSVKTGDHSGAGTDAHVHVIIHGEKRDTGKHILKTSLTHKEKFERDHVDIFNIEAIDVGAIEKLTIGHDNKGGFAGWYLDNVVVATPSESCTFVADRWLDKKEGDGKLEIDLFPVGRKEITADFLTETDAKAPVINDDKHISTNGETAPLINGNKHVSEDCGDLALVEGDKHIYDENETAPVLYDDKHTSENGHTENHGIKMYRETVVKKVVKVQMVEYPVEDGNTEHQHEIHSPANDEVKEQAKELIEEETVQQEVTGDVECEPDFGFSTDIQVQDVTEEIAEDNKSEGELIMEDVQVEYVADVQNEPNFDFGINGNADGKSDSELATEEVEQEVADSSDRKDNEGKKLYVLEHIEEVNAGTRFYKIDVKTGDVKYAGTDANVFIILYGKNVDSGKLMLKKSATHRDPFERNHTDTFTLEARNVGKVEKIRIGHDNKGGMAGWYLDDVVVSELESGFKCRFPANRWLDKKEGDRKLEIDCFPAE